MASDRSLVSRRLLTGALGGLIGTAAMTAAMPRTHRRLPDAERYPLPPREVIQSVTGRTASDRRASEGELQDLTWCALRLRRRYGALYAVLRPSDGIAAGAGYGVLVWAASYLGWISGLAILKPATRHPLRRNGLMLAAHVVWGVTTALTVRELQRAETEVFAGRAARPAARSPAPSAELQVACDTFEAHHSASCGPRLPLRHLGVPHSSRRVLHPRHSVRVEQPVDVLAAAFQDAVQLFAEGVLAFAQPHGDVELEAQRREARGIRDRHRLQRDRGMLGEIPADRSPDRGHVESPLATASTIRAGGSGSR